MQKVIKGFWLGPAVSGVLTYIVVCRINFFTSWICFIPLFISISNTSPKNTFKKGFFFGVIFACLAFFWMIPGAERFTGHSLFYGFAVFSISAFLISLYHGCVFWCFSSLKKNNGQRFSTILNSILIASLFTAGEAIRMFFSTGLPWFDIHSGIGLTDNLYSIQPASFLGVHLLTFVVVLVNYFTASFLLRKQNKKLLIPVGIILIFLLSGYLIFNSFNKNSAGSKPFTVAILAENIAPDLKWDDNTGNALVQRLLDLNRSAVNLKPDLILWSESAIPWTYSKDDDLVKEVLYITQPAQALHILGINTAYKENEIYNSAYCILPNGNITGRYDKQYLLSFIEKPLSGVLMPFFSSKGFIARNSVEHAAPLPTSFGKAGVLICNEAAIPAAAASMVKQGAQFLFNISNDGWFNDTYIVRLHYYYARLRAVESRKDLAINSNNGYSGMVKASGEIVEQERSEVPFVKLVSMQPNNIVSMASSFPNVFVYACVIYILVFTLVSFFVHKGKSE